MHAHHARKAAAILGETTNRKRILAPLPTLGGPDDRPKQPLVAANWITVPPKPRVTHDRTRKVTGWERTIGAHDPHNVGREYTNSPPSYDGGTTSRNMMLTPEQAVNGSNHRK